MQRTTAHLLKSLDFSYLSRDEHHSMGSTPSREAAKTGHEHAFTAPRDKKMMHAAADSTKTSDESKEEASLQTREAAVSVREVEMHKREKDVKIREKNIEQCEKAVAPAVRALQDRRLDRLEKTQAPEQEPASTAPSTQDSRISSGQHAPTSHTARVTLHSNGGIMYEDDFVRECLVRPGGSPPIGEATATTYRFTAGTGYETTSIPSRGTRPPGSFESSENEADDEGCKCGMQHVHIVETRGSE